jgi:hypothetical protein
MVTLALKKLLIIGALENDIWNCKAFRSIILMDSSQCSLSKHAAPLTLWINDS